MAMATLYATPSILLMSTPNSSFCGRPAAVQNFTPRLRNGFSKRRGNVRRSATDDETKKVPLWRKELTSLEDSAGENFSQNAAMEEDISRLQKKRDLEKRLEEFQRKEVRDPDEGQGAVKLAVDKVLVADFFFILFSLAWLVAGLVERAVLESTALIDSWLPLWPSVFQPALGVFMAGALVSAVSGLLSRSANK